MRNIKIDDLRPSGTELFSDSESYLRELSEELSEDELDIKGGAISTPACAVVTIGIVIGGAIISSCNGKKKPQT